jgi:hypothetical protein
MARTRSVNHVTRICRGEGARRHMKNPDAATPRIRQHCWAEKPCPASSAITGYLAFGRTPSSNSAAAFFTSSSSVSSSRIRRLAAASSPCSAVDVPGFTPRSTRSCAFHRYTVASAKPNSAATTRTGECRQVVRPRLSSRNLAPHDGCDSGRW